MLQVTPGSKRVYADSACVQANDWENSGKLNMYLGICKANENRLVGGKDLIVFFFCHDKIYNSYKNLVNLIFS